MEVVVGTMAGKIAPKLFDFLATNRKLRQELEHDIEYMKNEILMISAAIAEDGDHPPWSSNQVHKAWIQMVRDLSHAIEDCIDHFTRHVTLHPSASWIHRQYHRVKTVRTRNKFATAIRRLRKRSEDASKLRTSYTTNSDGRSNTLKSARAFDEEQTNNTMAMAAVGMDAPQAELMELIKETSHGQQPKELMVISLVGFGGLGKTFLAKHVYDTTKIEYEKRAWVCAADKRPWDVLTEILSQLGKPSAITSSGGSAGSSGHLNTLCTSLKECLGNKRFFVVIDDMQEVFWHEIKDAFPVVSGVSSRVMVTTTIQSVANTCSSAHGHVYVMRTLPEDHSRQLFFKEACREDPPPPSDDTQLGSEALKKCDGLPLALITTARFLQSGGDPTREKWANLCKNLGTHLETNEILASMKRVLVHSYTSLGSQDVKTCLLYLGIYPSGHPIRRGSLIRRWLAEGFIKEDNNRSALSIAIDNFNELVNRSIIQPINASSSAEVKKYQTHGMMLEFILHKSMCENFVTVLYDKDPLPGSNIRWLSMHQKNAAMPKMNRKDLRLVRSLTIFSKVHKSVLDFPKYELLRVLDLEKCDVHLEEKHLREICTNLLLLRYLGLGGTTTATVLPKEINKLRFLETLDVRRTRIEILPTQVIELPCLIHLLGKFRLQQDVGLGVRKMRKLQNWLSENSKLETIAGFLGDKNQELPQLMSHMEHLTKVKIWCESTADVSSNLSHLSQAIKGFIKRGTDMETSLSLTLNFSGERSQELLNFSLENHYSYYLSSLKLQGNNIFGLPPFVTMLAGLTKLCLSFPHHWLSGDIIDALSRVRGLEYLKLTATQLDKLIIRQGAFRSLRRLCIVVEVMTELEIQDGALPRLDSFWLLCKDLNGFSGTMIQSLPRLKEVALYDGVCDETKHEWKEAAKNQPRRPKLLFVKMKPMKTEPAEEIIPATIANDTTATEFDVGSEPAAEISTALTNTDTTTKEGELAENSQSPVAPPTDMKLSMTTPDNVVSTGESVQVDGGQHDDDEKDLDSTEDPKYFATKNDTTTQVIDQMNKGSSEEEMEGVVGLEGLQMEDGTQERGLQNKHRLRTRLLSLVAIGVFRQKSGQGRLVPGLG